MPVWKGIFYFIGGGFIMMVSTDAFVRGMGLMMIGIGLSYIIFDDFIEGLTSRRR